MTEKIPKYASIKDSTPKNEEVGLVLSFMTKTAIGRAAGSYCLCLWNEGWPQNGTERRVGMQRSRVAQGFSLKEPLFFLYALHAVGDSTHSCSIGL